MNSSPIKRNAIHRISNRSRNPPGRLVPAINSKSGSCAAAVPHRPKTPSSAMLPAITRSPVFQILCVTGRMTLLCSFCTCPSKNGSAIGVPFSSVLHTFHPKSIPLSTISTDFAVFQASSNEEKCICGTVSRSRIKIPPTIHG